MSISMIDNIPKFLGIEKAAEKVGAWLDKHPVVNTIIMIANHIFRTVAMITLMYFLPFSPIANMAIGVAASLFYRITVERFCSFQFALPAMLGAIAFEASRPSILLMVQGVAFQSLAGFASAFVGIIPMIWYGITIVHLACTDVERKYKQTQAAPADDCGTCCTVPKRKPQPLVPRTEPSCCSNRTALKHQRA